MKEGSSNGPVMVQCSSQIHVAGLLCSLKDGDMVFFKLNFISQMNVFKCSTQIAKDVNVQNQKACQPCF